MYAYICVYATKLACFVCHVIRIGSFLIFGERKDFSCLHNFFVDLCVYLYEYNKKNCEQKKIDVNFTVESFNGTKTVIKRNAAISNLYD